VRLLLDSHVVLWWDKDLSKLSDAQREAISDPDNEVFVSAVSAWELGIKRSAGKLALTESIQVLTRRFGFAELPITMAHGELAAALPLHHKDPFDRMLVAQAILERMVLVTADRRLGEYPVTLLQG
jgi:PIN domain nuclease of toxin-antitoxin system